MKIDDPLKNHFHISVRQESGLRRLGIKTVRDILYHFPIRYQTYKERKIIADISAGDEATIVGRVVKSKAEKTWKKKINIAETLVSDGSGMMRIVWFNQPYMAKILSGAKDYVFSGKVLRDKKGFYMANPRYEIAAANYPTGIVDDIQTCGQTNKKIVAIYPETNGVTSRWFEYAIQKILPLVKNETIILPDPLNENIRKKYNLPSLRTSHLAIHEPQDERHSEAARKRFAFEEIFYIQLERLKQRMLYQQSPAFSIEKTDEIIERFIKNLQFTLTLAQKRAIEAIKKDLQKPFPMSRLLEGDVGSGKTAVAASIIAAVAENRLQAAFMAPTEVLARQHYNEFITMFERARIQIGLLTSSETRKFPSKINTCKDTHISRNQLLRWIASGEIRVVIGTHSLIQDRVAFKNLALAVIDEQHRFGIKQRALLLKRDQKSTSFGYNSRYSDRLMPHLLSMTATPIPRTLALTIYGDLDLTLLDEMPPGRKQIITKIIEPQEREHAYEEMRAEIKKGRQAYVVCPRIEEQSDVESFCALEMKSVKAEYQKLKNNIFPEFSIGMLHGKMLPKEKEKIMNDFRDGKINVLVTTSVIEVGVNVPNATVMMIEGAERFGLAQLHQLRGRVLRSTHQPYCFVFTESKSHKTRERLSALLRAKNGFELAEYDLQFRGAGELAGTNQWGVSDIAMEALKNIKMVEAARTEAQQILEDDFELKKYPLLRERLEKMKTDMMHWE